MSETKQDIQKHIYDLLKHLSSSFFIKFVNQFNPFMHNFVK